MQQDDRVPGPEVAVPDRDEGVDVIPLTESSPSRKPWGELSEAEIREVKMKWCNKCYYRSKINGESCYSSSFTCDYILIVGHSRGCDPRDCVEKGVYKPGGKIKQRDFRFRNYQKRTGI